MNLDTGDMAAGQALFASCVSQLPSRWSGCAKGTYDRGSTWHFKESVNWPETSFPIAPANYTYRIMGFNSSDPQESKGKANKAIFWYDGANIDGKPAGKLWMRLEGAEEQKIEISKTGTIPSDVFGDNTMPDTNTQGEWGNPSGGGGMEQDIEDINEMMAEDETGMDMGLGGEEDLGQEHETTQEGEDDEGQEDIYEQDEDEEDEDDEEEEEQEEDESDEHDENANDNLHENTGEEEQEEGS